MVESHKSLFKVYTKNIVHFLLVAGGGKGKFLKTDQN